MEQDAKKPKSPDLNEQVEQILEQVQNPYLSLSPKNLKEPISPSKSNNEHSDSFDQHQQALLDENQGSDSNQNPHSEDFLVNILPETDSYQRFQTENEWCIESVLDQGMGIDSNSELDLFWNQDNCVDQSWDTPFIPHVAHHCTINAQKETSS